MSTQQLEELEKRERDVWLHYNFFFIINLMILSNDIRAFFYFTKISLFVCLVLILCFVCLFDVNFNKFSFFLPVSEVLRSLSSLYCYLLQAKYRDRAKERRTKFGPSEPPINKKKDAYLRSMASYDPFHLLLMLITRFMKLYIIKNNI